jgi:hypothetical protein
MVTNRQSVHGGAAAALEAYYVPQPADIVRVVNELIGR